MTSLRSAFVFVLSASAGLLVPAISSAGDKPAKLIDSPLGQAVNVTLKPTADVSDADIRVADVAVVEGGTEQIREQIARLDLAEPPRPGQTVRLTAQHVAVRIRLAGFDEHQFSVRGSREVRVSLASQEIAEKDIVAAAQRYLRSRLPWDADDVSIQQVQPLPKAIAVSTKEQVRLEPEWRSQRLPLGRVRVDVIVWTGGRKHQEIPVLLDVRVYQQVAVATRRIERGQLVTEEVVFFDRRPVDGLSDFVTAKDSPVGQRAKRTIAARQIIGAADVEPAQTENQVIVRQGDVVTLSARIGGLRVQATGEAMQDGAAGKVIRVRNANSKVVVTGRIMDRSTVEVLR